MKNERFLAYGLIAFGVVLLLTRLGGADWLWLTLLSVIFLLGYVSRKNYGFLVAGGVLMGLAVGTLIGTQSGVLLSMAVGFFAIDRVEPRANRWALYAAGIFAVLGGLSALSAVGLLSSVGFALVLIAAGGYLLLRDRRAEPNTPHDPYSYTPPTFTAATPAAGKTAGETASPTPEPPRRSEATPHPTPQPAVVPVQPDTAIGAATPPAETAAAPPVPNGAPGTVKLELSPEAGEYLRRLEAWRKQTAGTEGTPPYIVFSNDTLSRIASAQPRTLEELAAVKGVGPVKLERYGGAVLGVLHGDAPNPAS